MKKYFFTVFLGLLTLTGASSGNSAEKNNAEPPPLVIFHIDMNSVALRKDYLEKWLLKLSQMGYNAILWEIEDKVKWETCPECVSKDAFTKEEFKGILDYSRKLGLQPIPLLQTIGHAEYVLQNENYTPFREKPDRYDCYCTSKPEVRDFIKKWIEEYRELFGDIKYFHLGGDEAYVFGSCSDCSDKIKSIGKNGLYNEYVNDISADLIAGGIRPGIWDDMIMKSPGEISVIPKEFVIWDWNYWDSDEIPEKVMLWSQGKRVAASEVSGEVKNLMPEILDGSGNLKGFYVCDYLKRLGYDVIVSSSSRSSGDAVFTGRHSVHSANIIGAAKKCAAENLLGTCVTSWAVRIANYEIQEPWILLAPLTIKNPSLDRNELLSMASQSIFGIEGNKFFDAISLIGFPFPFSDQRTTGIMWTGMKDSRPAPPGYIATLIDKWKKDMTYDTNTRIIKSAVPKITKGINLLNEFIPHLTRGYDVINAWSKGGYFQYWQSVIAGKIIQLEGNDSVGVNENFLNQIKILRADYLQWADDWMTTNSAFQSTGLIYDAIQYYMDNSIKNK